MNHDKQDPGPGPLPPPGDRSDPDAATIVDGPSTAPPGPGLLARARGAKRRPVVPAWARSRREFEYAAKGVAAYAGHVSAYHVARAPWYGLRLAVRAPRGAARFVGGVLRWLVDAEGEPLRQTAATREDIEEYLKLSRQRDRRVRWRAVVGVAASVLGPVIAWFEHPKCGAEFEEHCTDLVKRGPALGITLLLATQRPDSRSLPTGISANATLRWCLKVMGQIENDMVLGTGSYKRGIRANTLAWGDKGIAWFVGEGADARIVRCVEINAPAADSLALRIRALREQAGRLTGHAIGDQTEADAASSYDLLADVAAALPSGKSKAWSEDVIARLAELRPDVYGHWSPEQLAAALKPYGVRTVQMWGTAADGKGANRRGVRRADISAAIAHRDDGTAAA